MAEMDLLLNVCKIYSHTDLFLFTTSVFGIAVEDGFIYVVRLQSN